MSNKTLFIAMAILGALVVVLVYQSGNPNLKSFEDRVTPGLEKFKEIERSKVERFTVKKGEKSAEIARKGDEWVLASSYGYPADKENIARFFNDLDKLEGWKQIGWERSSHEEFEVNSEKGVQVSFYDGSDNELASVTFGKDRHGNTFQSYSSVRFGDEDDVYEVKGSARGSVGGSSDELNADYLLFKKLFEIPEDREVHTAEILRPDHNIVLERRWEEKPKPEEEESAEKEEDEAAEGEKSDEAGDAPEEEKVERDEVFYVASGPESWKVDKEKWKDWEVRSYLNKNELRIDKAVDPSKDLSEYGLDKPQLKVVLRHRNKEEAKEGKETEEQSVTVLFGNAIKEEGDGGEEGDAGAAEDKGYYVTLGGVDGDSRRIYTIEKWAFGSWNKDLKDFQKEEEKKKKEEETTEEKTDEKTTESGSAAPGSAIPPPGEEPAAAEKPTTTSGVSHRPVLPDTAPVIPPPAGVTTGPGTVTATPTPVPPPTPAPTPPAQDPVVPPAKVRASHILIPYKGATRADPAVTRSKEEARKEAERLLGELKKDLSKFEALARDHSSCPSSKKGGDLGEFSRGVMARPFEEAAFKLQVGQVSGVVETDFGFHVIKRTQ